MPDASRLYSYHHLIIVLHHVQNLGLRIHFISFPLCLNVTINAEADLLNSGNGAGTGIYTPVRGI